MIALWIQEAGQVVRELIGTVGSATEYRVLVALVIVAFIFGLFNIAAAMGATMSTPLRVFLVSVVGAVLVLAGVVAVRLYLLPNLHPSNMTPWLPLVAAGIVILVAVAPLTKCLLSTGYFEGVLALVLSAAAAALVVVMAQAGFNAFRSGDKGFNKTEKRRNGINRIIDDV